MTSGVQGLRIHRGGDQLKTWEAVGLGRCWVMRFTNTANGGSCGSGPNSAAEFLLEPRPCLRNDLNNEGFSVPPPKQTRGAEVRTRYTSESEHHREGAFAGDTIGRDLQDRAAHPTAVPGA